jgi:hypothetical protein
MALGPVMISGLSLPGSSLSFPFIRFGVLPIYPVTVSVPGRGTIYLSNQADNIAPDGEGLSSLSGLPVFILL